MSTAAILLAGGQGSRMKSPLYKQYLNLGNKPVARHSFDILLGIEEINEIVVVCEPIYEEIFKTSDPLKKVLFALPGKRRQDSVYNGLLAVSNREKLICIHDSARPLITEDLIKKVLLAGLKWGAATLGIQMKSTIKECSQDLFVIKTPDRSVLWEIQTPQVLHKDILLKGFEYAIKQGLTVTDDVSLAELIGHAVKIVEGSQQNIKLTVQEDYILAQEIFNR